MKTSALRVIALLMLPGIASAVSFTPLGYLDGDSVSSAYAVSPDGSVVVGRSESSQDSGQAFRWSSGSGMVGLGGSSIAAYGVSADGSVVVGSHRLDFEGRPSPFRGAFRWTSSTGVTPLLSIGDLDGSSGGRGSDVSADGRTVVGLAGSYAEFRWTIDDGLSDLGTIHGEERALGVSADGNVVVGYSSNPSESEAFRWTSGDGMIGLGDLGWGVAPFYNYQSIAHGISADGNVIVGRARNVAGIYEAFRWTENSGMVGLGLLDGMDESWALSASGDGSVIVGDSYSYDGNESHAFVWTEAGGMQGLLELLVAGGVDLKGWTLGTAAGISDDGRWVVGEGINPDDQREAFLANIAPAVVPIPPALWLFGSALGLMGWMRRKLSS